MRIFWKTASSLSMLPLGVSVIGGRTPKPDPLPEAQAAAARAAPPDQDPNILGPEDPLEISLDKEPGLTKQLVVRPDGKITYLLVGEIQASGLTVKKLHGERKYLAF